MSIKNYPPERDQILDAINQEMRRLSTVTVLLHQAIAERLGLNATDHKCLGIIMETDSMTAGQLAELTNLTTGAVTGVIDRLEKAGYVQRVADPNDRRRVIIQPMREKAITEIIPLFLSLQQEMNELCSKYNDQQLSLILDFASRSNDLAHDFAAKLRKEAIPFTKAKQGRTTGQDGL